MKRISGTTLIELIMTIAIGAFLVGGLTLSYQQQVKSSTQMRDFLIAMNLAQEWQADANNTDFDALSNTIGVGLQGFHIKMIVDIASSTPINDPEYPGGSYTVALKMIDIRVILTGGNFDSPLARLVTYRVNHAQFGNGVA